MTEFWFFWYGVNEHPKFAGGKRVKRPFYGFRLKNDLTREEMLREIKRRLRKGSISRVQGGEDWIIMKKEFGRLTKTEEEFYNVW